MQLNYCNANHTISRKFENKIKITLKLENCLLLIVFIIDFQSHLKPKGLYKQTNQLKRRTNFSLQTIERGKLKIDQFVRF